MTADHSGFDDGKSKLEVKIMGLRLNESKFSGGMILNRIENENYSAYNLLSDR